MRREWAPPAWLRFPAWLRPFVPAVLVVAVQLVFFPAPAGQWVRGAIVGGLSALVALGMALIYRSNRILNFAQGDLGTVPVVAVVLLVANAGLPYFLAAGIGLVGAVALAVVVELAIIRRFFKAPRLVLTVATIGVSALLAGLAVLMPQWFHTELLAPRLPQAFNFHFEISPIIFGANDLLAVIVVPVAVALLGLFLTRTDAGIAVRASAERGDRAGLLGIPVKRLQTLVWAIAGVLAFTATFLRAGILGLPVGPALSYGTLLRAFAALLLGGMTDLPAVTASAVALGVLEFGITWHASNPAIVDPILALVIAAALLVRRQAMTRVGDEETSSWKAAAAARPVPPELRKLPEVRAARLGGVVVLGGLLILLPNLIAPDVSLKASALIIYAILAISVVTLTGWAGQVSLGQVAFFAIGAALGAKATSAWHVDLSVACLLCAAVGAAVSVVVGLPALRIRGLLLAAVTFGFALATTSYFLNTSFFGWIPTNRIPRPPLFGRIGLDSPTRIYYLALAGLALVVTALHGIRHSRTGRVLVAVRENERAAQSYGVSVVRAKLTAFALSGAIAAFAGCLFVHHQQAFGSGPYDPGQNLVVFTMAVIGGVASVPGALLGALYIKGSEWFLPASWQFLASGIGVLLVLLILPAGLGGLFARLRDEALKAVARRRGVDVPALLADTGGAELPPPVPRAAFTPVAVPASAGPDP
jgi:branched-chain amino acid transport system permease protein